MSEVVNVSAQAGFRVPAARVWMRDIRDLPARVPLVVNVSSDRVERASDQAERSDVPGDDSGAR